MSFKFLGQKWSKADLVPKERKMSQWEILRRHGRLPQSTPKSQWSVILNLLRDRIALATKVVKDNGQHMSLEEHNNYNRAVFANVREEIASRVDIPNAVMDPPTQTLTLTFYGGWNETACHGCIDFLDADDVIHVEMHAREDEPDGVTKDDLIRCICEVLYGGLHMVHKDSKKETAIVLSDLNWMGTTRLCNLMDNIIYIGYMPATGQEKSKEQVTEQQSTERAYDIVWKAEALGNGVVSIQGYDHNYSRKLWKIKGWKEEDWNMFNGL